MRKELNIIRGHLALKLRGHFTFGITEKCAEFQNNLGPGNEALSLYLCALSPD